MVKTLDNTASFANKSASINILAGANVCAIEPTDNSAAFTSPSCLLHPVPAIRDSYSSINWMASPVPALQLELKQQKVFVLG